MNTEDKNLENRRYRLFDLTWVEVKEWLEKTDVVLVPIGSTEQHGPHLPTGIDSYAAYYVCLEAAKQAEVPVAPLIPVGYSPFHMRPHEPGTITLRDETLFNLMYDIGRSLIYHGFKKIVYVTGHTSNAPTLDKVVRAIRYDTGALAINYAADTEVFAELCQDLIEGKDQLPGWHGGEIETSGALLFCPELVHLERAKLSLPYNPPWLPEGSEKKSGSGFQFYFHGYPVRAPFDQWEYSECGIMGNPLLASREKGEKIYSRMIGILVEFLRQLKQIPVEVKKCDFPERV
ncbi:creatinine amidohydrolase [Thermanaeromonas toyohensis ToBE]|uniref:Creatinine amidohydrolase n=1 Tax=Thermanaeromonas toyohensis ToBE TaxID=698762 RepID=A0A1W1VKC4_9FIRM|nr:creatininase family protein [Thermanaeromonas toyohensis]SMB93670.1 creatinine amidohydrolase [Thermanaeromonas toyohensis ToBE]